MKHGSNKHFAIETATFTVVEWLSTLSGKIVLPWSCRDHLYKARELSLYIEFLHVR